VQILLPVLLQVFITDQLDFPLLNSGFQFFICKQANYIFMQLNGVVLFNLIIKLNTGIRGR